MPKGFVDFDVSSVHSFDIHESEKKHMTEFII